MNLHAFLFGHLHPIHQHAQALRAAVSSPSGTTVAAIAELDRHDVRAAMAAAVAAAHARSLEVGAPQG